MPLTPEQIEMLKQSINANQIQQQVQPQPEFNPANRPAISSFLPGLSQSPEPVKTNYEQQILDARKQEALKNIMGSQSSVK